MNYKSEKISGFLLIVHLNTILKQSLGDRLLAVNLFGSLTTEKSDRYMEDLDMCIFLKGTADNGIIISLKEIYYSVIQEASSYGFKSYHGPVVIFEQEPLLINSILAQHINKGIFLINDSKIKRIQINTKYNHLLQGEMFYLLKEHLHFMRMSLMSLTEYCSESQEEYVTRFHGMVALRCLLFLKGENVPIGGYSALKKSQFRITNDDDIKSYLDFVIAHNNFNIRCKFHCDLVLSMKEVISTLCPKQINNKIIIIKS
jgi:hypothetical protein